MISERLLVDKTLEIIKDYKGKIKKIVMPKIGRKSATEFLEKFDFEGMLSSRIYVYQKTLQHTKSSLSEKAEDDCFNAKKRLDDFLVVYAKKYIDFLYNPPMTDKETKELIQEVSRFLENIKKY